MEAALSGSQGLWLHHSYVPISQGQSPRNSITTGRCKDPLAEATEQEIAAMLGVIGKPN